MFGSILGSIAGAAVSGLLGNKGAKDAGDSNAALQREFAQNGIRWKVEDAKAAGIHPLYAIGAPTFSASPSYVAPGVPDLTTVGQDIGRAIDAKRTPPERTTARLEQLSVQRAELENQLLASQIAKINQPGSPPPLPGGSSIIEGQQADAVNIPSEVIQGSLDNPQRQAGDITTHQFTRGPNPTIVPSAEMKQRIEDDAISQVLWHIKNRIIAPPHSDPDMYWSVLTQDYRRNPIPRHIRERVRGWFE